MQIDLQLDIRSQKSIADRYAVGFHDSIIDLLQIFSLIFQSSFGGCVKKKMSTAALQIVMNTDGTIPVLAACVGDVCVLNADKKDEWTSPVEVFDLWGTRPNIPEWNALAEKAKIIVCWIKADAENIKGKFSAEIRTVAQHLDDIILASLRPSEEPSLQECVRDRGFYDSLRYFDLPDDIRKVRLIAYNKTLRNMIHAKFNSFYDIGKKLIVDDYEKHPDPRCDEFPTPNRTGTTIVIENVGFPVLLTAQLVLLTEKYDTVVQIIKTRPGAINVQSKYDLDPAVFFKTDDAGNLMGGGGCRNMGGKAKDMYLNMNLRMNFSLTCAVKHM